MKMAKYFFTPLPYKKICIVLYNFEQCASLLRILINDVMKMSYISKMFYEHWLYHSIHLIYVKWVLLSDKITHPEIFRIEWFQSLVIIRALPIQQWFFQLNINFKWWTFNLIKLVQCCRTSVFSLFSLCQSYSLTRMPFVCSYSPDE